MFSQNTHASERNKKCAKGDSPPFHLFLALLLVLPLLLTGCAGRRVIFTTGFASDELFTVGDASATMTEYRVYFTNLQRQYEETYGTQIFDNTGDETLEQQIKDNALARLSKVKVLNLMAQDAELSLDEEEQSRVQAAAQTYEASLNDAEKAYLEVDESTLVTMYTEYALAQKEYEAILDTVDQEVSDDEARSVTCQQIRILNANYTDESAAHSRADAILQEIRDGMANLTGVTFDTYISEYNEADTSQLTISRQDGDNALTQAAFSLDVGKISDVIQTDDGWCILKCIEGYNEEQIQQNKQTILAERQQTAFETAYNTYVRNLDYNLDNDKYQSITRVSDPQITTSSFFSTLD